jgi:hypothetical protein
MQPWIQGLAEKEAEVQRIELNAGAFIHEDAGEESGSLGSGRVHFWERALVIRMTSMLI